MSVMNEYKREFELRKNGVTDMCEYNEFRRTISRVLLERLTTEMPQKWLLKNFRNISGNLSNLEKFEGFPNIIESFPNIYGCDVSYNALFKHV